jgi:acetyl-CoA C-acetyltransferase
MRRAVIVSASRTPVGKFQGGLSPLSAVQLGALTLNETLRRGGIAPGLVEEVILGQVLQAGCGQNPARQAALQSGLPSSVGAFTVNKVCGSGLKAVLLAAQSILAGDQDVVLAGGMESMSNAPYLLPGARKGYRSGHAQVQDANLRDGLWCALTDQHMGMTAERVAKKYGISREEQDRYALESHRRAIAATDEGRFSEEILSVEVRSGKSVELVSTDEGPRRDTSLEALARLKPAFDPKGTVTAGNAPGLNDSAASLLLMSEERAKDLGVRPLAEIVGYATAGLDPEWVMMTPVPATQKLLKRIGWSSSDVGLWEINEAFAVQALAVTRELGLDPGQVNVHGGAVALGHPIGASGARILVTLLHALQQGNLRTGIATLCMGGGNGLATAIRLL